MNVIKRKSKVSIEGLEARVLLAAHVWTGAGGNSNWSNASNWTGGAPSAAESNVTLDFPNGVSNATASNDISGLTIQSMTLEGAYDILGTGFSLAGSIMTSGAGGGAIDNNVTLAANSTLNLNGQLNMGGVISGSATLQLTGGTVYLSGNNTYTGTTTIANGLLYLGSNTGLGSTLGGTIVESGGSIMLDLGVTCAEPLTLSGSGYQYGWANAAVYPREASSGASTTIATLSGPITLSGGASVAGRPASDGGSSGIQTTLAITGAIGGTGDLTVTNGGVKLAAVNTFSGNVVVTGGALTLNASGGASVPGNLTVSGGTVESKTSGQFTSTGTAALASGTTLTIDATDTIGSVTGTGTLAGAGTITVETGATDNFTGTISGSVSLGMGGNGELIIGGSSTDSTTGQISISHGTLLVNASLPSATLTQTGGELAGGGTVSSLTSSGGNIEPGSFDPGTLSVTGSIHLASGSNYDWIAQDGADYTSLSAGGAVTVAGNFYVAGLGSGYVPAIGTVFTVIHNTSGSPVSGTFIGMPEGQVISYQNRNWQISYVGAGGHDVTLAFLGRPTTISASATSASAPVGQTVLQATVSSGVSGAPTPTGNVTFKYGSTTIGAAALDSTGTATLDASSLPVGSYSISAFYTGDPNYIVSSTATPVNVNVMPGLSFGNASVTESASGGTADFTLTLTAASSVPVTVNYATQDGTAHAGRDYQSASGTVTFNPGQTSQTIAVTTFGNGAWEPSRDFSILYSSVSNAAISTTFSTATIQSTDGRPAAGLIPDELDPTQSDLVVYAPAGHDAIQVKPTKVAGQAQVVINGKTVAVNSGIDRVIVYGGAGSNTLSVNPRIRSGVIFFGGTGRNVITGGAGNDILVGGSGPNVLADGRGMNLLVGGAGKATLTGSPAGNVLVGGATEYDGGALSDILSLETLLSTWTSGAAFAARAAALAAANGPTGATLGSSAVALNVADHLTGRKNHDLVLAAVVTKPVRSAR